LRPRDDRSEEEKGKSSIGAARGFEGAWRNSYMREEQLSDLLDDVIAPIQITKDIAHRIARALRNRAGGGVPPRPLHDDVASVLSILLYLFATDAWLPGSGAPGFWAGDR
jgi:hypothetical protein